MQNPSPPTPNAGGPLSSQNKRGKEKDSLVQLSHPPFVADIMWVMSLTHAIPSVKGWTLQGHEPKHMFFLCLVFASYFSHSDVRRNSNSCHTTRPLWWVMLRGSRGCDSLSMKNREGRYFSLPRIILLWQYIRQSLIDGIIYLYFLVCGQVWNGCEMENVPYRLMCWTLVPSCLHCLGKVVPIRR